MRIAVLHQAVEPPVVNGVRKPKKPGGMKFCCNQTRSPVADRISRSKATKTPEPTSVSSFTRPATM